MRYGSKHKLAIKLHDLQHFQVSIRITKRCRLMPLQEVFRKIETEKLFKHKHAHLLIYITKKFISISYTCSCNFFQIKSFRFDGPKGIEYLLF